MYPVLLFIKSLGKVFYVSCLAQTHVSHLAELPFVFWLLYNILWFLLEEEINSWCMCNLNVYPGCCSLDDRFQPFFKIDHHTRKKIFTICKKKKNPYIFKSWYSNQKNYNPLIMKEC